MRSTALFLEFSICSIVVELFQSVTLLSLQHGGVLGVLWGSCVRNTLIALMWVRLILVCSRSSPHITTELDNTNRAGVRSNTLSRSVMPVLLLQSHVGRGVLTLNQVHEDHRSSKPPPVGAQDEELTCTK